MIEMVEAKADLQKLDPLRPLRGDKLAIVGFSETTRDQAPYDDPDTEIWLCNRLGVIFEPLEGKRWDRHFDPHPLDWSKINHKEPDWETYAEWFAKDHGDRLVYLPRLDPETLEVPNAVAFPKEEVIAGVGGREYFTSAIGWQLGLALLLHQMYGSPKWIGMYGIDLRGPLEYEFQRPNAEWLLGLAEGRGVELYIPEESALLNRDNRAPLYGVEIYSGFMGEIEKALEEDVKRVDAELAKLHAESDRVTKAIHEWAGYRQADINWRTRVIQYRRGGKL